MKNIKWNIQRKGISSTPIKLKKPPSVPIYRRIKENGFASRLERESPEILADLLWTAYLCNELIATELAIYIVKIHTMTKIIISMDYL
jgi:hypothetical protein